MMLATDVRNSKPELISVSQVKLTQLLSGFTFPDNRGKICFFFGTGLFCQICAVYSLICKDLLDDSSKNDQKSTSEHSHCVTIN